MRPYWANVRIENCDSQKIAVFIDKLGCFVRPFGGDAIWFLTARQGCLSSRKISVADQASTVKNSSS